MQVSTRYDGRALERCPLCRTALAAPDRAAVRCARCGTESHADCARELNDGRCAVHGCERPLAVSARGPATTRWSRWRLAALLALGGAAVAAAAFAATLALLPASGPADDRCPCGLPFSNLPGEISHELR